MQRFLSSIVIFLFFVWILPLGAFFKPSQAKIACDGQRAICLCPHLLAKQAAKNAGKTLYKGSGAAQKEQAGAGGASHYFLFVQKKNQINKQPYFYHPQQSFLYSLLDVRPIEHVPKA